MVSGDILVFRGSIFTYSRKHLKGFFAPQGICVKQFSVPIPWLMNTLDTLPETNSSPLKIDGWKMNFL